MNPHQGDVPLIVADKQYILRYNHAALIKLEHTLDKSLMRIMQEITKPEDMRMGTVAALLWAGLQKHHPELKFDDAIALLDDIEGGAQAAVAALGEAFQRAFNAPGTKGTNPPVKGNGTGIPSSLSTSVSAMPLPISGSSPHEN